MDPIKIIVKTVREVDYKDLEEFAVQIYPHLKGYSFVATAQCGNDSTHTFRVTGDLDQSDIRDWDAVEFHFDLNSNYLLMDKLCKDGHIEPGEYVVKVYW